MVWWAVQPALKIQKLVSAVEKISLRINSKAIQAERSASLCGVVGSGNLEILFRKGKEANVCLFEINTSANGFATTWESVVRDFAESNSVGGLQIVVNDMGATPAVVMLRLNQGLAIYTGAA